MSVETPSEEALRSALDAVLDRVGTTLDETGESFPYFHEGGDSWVTTPDGNWCGGHWIGLLWLAADRTTDRDGRFERAARQHTERMRSYMPRSSMFCGMNFHYAGFRAYDVTGDRSLFALGLEGADAMRSLYDDGARQIPLGDLDIKGPEQFRGPESDHGPPGERIAAVDNSYTALPVLWRAYRETGDPGFRDVAVSHADRHLDWFVRPDGRTWHHAVFDESGDLVRQYNELAHSDETCWARGQGWNIAGLARAYTETGAPRYRSALERTVSYYRRRSPDDHVPYWDFETPEAPDTYRDTSAAAITAYGLVRLPDDPAVADLRSYGETILASILDSYLVTDETDPRYGAVRQGCFNAPGEYAADAELIWTNYYVARAIDALRSGREP